MHNRDDHLELLALIENELDAATAAQLRKRLASEPRVLEAIERMRHDRSGLRAVGEIHVPADVLDQLETLLARPMLAEPIEPLNGSLPGNGAIYAAPGQFRKEHRRQALRIRWRRITVAAIVVMALIAGVWAAVNGLLPAPRSSNDGTVAFNQTNDQTQATDAISVDELTGTIHHALPRMGETRPLMASTSEALPSARSASAVEAAPIVLEFALVLHADDLDQAEAALASIAGEVDRDVALVRNFSFAEATRIAQERQPEGGMRRDPHSNPMVASAAGDRAPSTTQLKSLAESVRRQIHGSTSHSSAADVSGQISGPREIAPSLEQQLDFSSRGATHSLAVPVSQLKSILERAAVATAQSTSLRPLSSEVEAETHAALSAWVHERARLQRAFDGLQKSPPDAIVLIPVIIQVN